MNDLERIERATLSAEYRTYAGMVGAAIAGAFMLPTREERDAAMARVVELQQKMVDIVAREPKC